MERGSATGTGVNGLLQHRLSIAGARSCRRKDARPAEEGPCRENREGRPANIRLRKRFGTLGRDHQELIEWSCHTKPRPFFTRGDSDRTAVEQAVGETAAPYPAAAPPAAAATAATPARN